MHYNAALLVCCLMFAKKLRFTSSAGSRPDFALNDTAMILIDHQEGTITWGSTTPLDLLKTNVIALATFAKGVNMPLVYTTSLESQAQGPLLKELQQIGPDEFNRRTQRAGIVNAWNDVNFANACRNTSRKNFVVAGVTTDVCVAPPAISAVAEGFRVKIVADACGSKNQIAEEMAWRRMENGGVELTSTTAIIAELVQSWGTPAGAAALKALHPTPTNSSNTGNVTRVGNDANCVRCPDIPLIMILVLTRVLLPNL